MSNKHHEIELGQVLARDRESQLFKYIRNYQHNMQSYPQPQCTECFVGFGVETNLSESSKTHNESSHNKLVQPMNELIFIIPFEYHSRNSHQRSMSVKFCLREEIFSVFCVIFQPSINIHLYLFQDKMRFYKGTNHYVVAVTCHKVSS